MVTRSRYIVKRNCLGCFRDCFVVTIITTGAHHADVRMTAGETFKLPKYDNDFRVTLLEEMEDMPYCYIVLYVDETVMCVPKGYDSSYSAHVACPHGAGYIRL